MPTVLLVRHAQASFGAAHYDVLSEHGHRQAAALAASLAEHGTRADRVVSGSLTRQRETAAPVAAGAGIAAEVDPDWNEYDAEAVLGVHGDGLSAVGLDGTALTGRAFQEQLNAALARWIAAGAQSATGESWPAFVARVTGALDALLGELAPGETALVSTSAGVVAAVCGAVLGDPETLFVDLQRVAVNTGATKLVRGRSGTALLSYNDHTHLERPGTSLVTYH